MGTGNSKDSHTTNLDRRDSKRNSKKKVKMEIQDEQTEIKEKCLRNIRVSSHLTIIMSMFSLN
jgi:hypothetical protein